MNQSDLSVVSKASIRSRLFSGGLWALIGRTGMAVSAMLINVLLARLLQPNEYGAYSLVVSIVSIGAIVAQGGFNQVAVRFVAAAISGDDYTRVAQVIAAIFQYGLVSIGIVGILLWSEGDWLGTYFFDSDIIAKASGYIALLVVLSSVQSLLAEVFRGMHQIKESAMAGGFVGNIVMCLGLGVLFALSGKISFVNAIVISVCGILVSLLLAVRNLGGLVKLQTYCPAKVRREILHGAWPLLFSNIAVVTLTQADLWIVGHYLPESELAIYAAASKVAQTLMLITTLLYAFLPPMIAELYAKGEINRLERLLQSAALFNSALVLPLLITIYIFPVKILSFLYGDYFSIGNKILLALSFGLFVNVLTGVRGYVLMMAGLGRVQLLIAFFSGFLNVVFCIYGAHYYGLNGVAYGAMLAMCLACFVELLVVKSKVGIWTFASAKYLVG